MDGSRLAFAAWTRRRCGTAAAGALAALLGLTASHDAAAKNKKKKRKRRKSRGPRCEALRTRCNPHNEKQLCCGALTCQKIAGFSGFRCCQDRNAACAVDDDCCANLRCNQESGEGFCDYPF